MKIAKLEIPTTNEELKQANKTITQLEKGCLVKLEKTHRHWLDKEFWLENDGRKRISCKFPICCETCKHVGVAFWHCHNPKSFKCHINVMPGDVCSHWEANQGLMIFCWYKLWKEESDKLWKQSLERVKEFHEDNQELVKNIKQIENKLKGDEIKNENID